MAMYGYPDPKMGRVRFISLAPMYTFVARLGEDVPTPTGGFGGWNSVARRRRRGLTVFDGNDPYKLDIPILFDHFRAGTSVEDDITALERMCGWGLPKGTYEPPLIAFDSNGVIPHDHHDNENLDWVVEDITFGTKVERNQYGNRIRQDVVVHVMEFVEDDNLKDNSSAARRRAKKEGARRRKKRRGKSHLVAVKTGETASSVGVRELGSASRTREILRANGIRDPKSVKPGQWLRIP
jgi:hypothetical protein